MHLHRQIETLKKMILSLGGLVEEHLRESIEAIGERDADRADTVIEGDHKIDQMEIDVEEECLHTLALHQPVAMDLRYIVAVLKINNDLERIGDLAVNLAQQAKFLAREPELEPPVNGLTDLYRLVPPMLKQSLDALVELDAELAEKVREQDDEVDEIHSKMYDRVEERLHEQPQQIEQLIHVLNISRQLERVADHACNIAEDVLYMVHGEIHRHGLTAGESSEG